MKETLRKLAMWLMIGVTAAAAFILALNITTESLDADSSMNNVVIDLDQSCTTEEPYKIEKE